MQSPGELTSRFKSFQRSLLSFVRTPTSEKKKTQRRSFPTPPTATSDCHIPAKTTPNSTKRRRSRNIGKCNDLPPPPFVDPVGSPDASDITEPPLVEQQKRGQRKQRVFKDGKLLYEWEQNSTHTTLRLPPDWTSNSSRYLQESKDIKVLIAPYFLKVGIIHKERGQKPRIEWKFGHTTGGTVRVEGSTWTTPEEHEMPDQGTIITLCKDKAGKWPHALVHHPTEEVKTIVCRPARPKQRRSERESVKNCEESRPSWFTRDIPKRKKSVSFTPRPSPSPKQRRSMQETLNKTREEAFTSTSSMRDIPKTSDAKKKKRFSAPGTSPSRRSMQEAVNKTRKETCTSPSMHDDIPKTPDTKKKKRFSAPGPSPSRRSMQEAVNKTRKETCTSRSMHDDIPKTPDNKKKKRFSAPSPSLTPKQSLSPSPKQRRSMQEAVDKTHEETCKSRSMHDIPKTPGTKKKKRLSAPGPSPSRRSMQETVNKTRKETCTSRSMHDDIPKTPDAKKKKRFSAPSPSLTPKQSLSPSPKQRRSMQETVNKTHEETCTSSSPICDTPKTPASKKKKRIVSALRRSRSRDPKNKKNVYDSKQRQSEKSAFFEEQQKFQRRSCEYTFKPSPSSSSHGFTSTRTQSTHPASEFSLGEFPASSRHSSDEYSMEPCFHNLGWQKAMDTAQHPIRRGDSSIHWNNHKPHVIPSIAASGFKRFSMADNGTSSAMMMEDILQGWMTTGSIHEEDEDSTINSSVDCPTNWSGLTGGIGYPQNPEGHPVPLEIGM